MMWENFERLTREGEIEELQCLSCGEFFITNHLTELNCEYNILYEDTVPVCPTCKSTGIHNSLLIGDSE